MVGPLIFGLRVWGCFARKQIKTGDDKNSELRKVKHCSSPLPKETVKYILTAAGSILTRSDLRHVRFSDISDPLLAGKQCLDLLINL